jgi:TRAP-type C4-dicarboxylate transport system substrate-binding protein
MKKMALIWCFILSLTLPLFAGSEATGQETYSFNYSQFVPITHPITQQCQAWARQIEIRSAGTIKFNHYPASTLVKPQEAWDATVKGMCDIANSVFAYTAGRFPVMSTLDLPLGYCSGAQAAQVANEFYKHFNPKETHDAKVLYVFAHSPGYFHTNKPVRRMEDLAGLRIRSTGMTAKIVKALGAVPVAMPQTEVYQALKKNIVDGNITAFEPLKSMNQASVIKYTTVTPATGYTAGFFVIMNRAKWNSLPPYVKGVFEEVSQKWGVFHGETWDTYDIIAREYSLSLGNKIIELSNEETARWRKALQPIFSDYIKYLNEQGLEGEKIVSTAQGLVKKLAGAYCK